MKPLATLIILLLPAFAFAQDPAGGVGVHGRAQTATGDAVSVRCRDVGDTGFEACGGGAGGGDGAIVDGVSAAIKATVFDRTNSNPLAAQLVDSNGDPVSVGGGTQYNQGTATTDTDSLTMAGCVRADTAAVATGVIDGDRARCIVDATGRMWVHVGTIDGGTITTVTNPVAVTQSGAWAGVGVTGPVTDAQLRATPVPISGTVTVTDGAGALNVIVDSGTTVVTQGTATNLKAEVIGAGTAGTANAGVVTVQGIAGMTKLLVTPDSVALPANQSVNVNQIGGAAVSTGVGAAGTGVQRVNDSATGTTASAVPAQAGYIGGNGSGNLTGVTVCDNWTPISQTTGTQIITGAASKKTYICSINLVTATAQNIALVAGTGTVCATGIAGLAGGTTAATGWNFAANGGLSQGNGLGAIIRGATNQDNICILQSGAGQVSGAVSWTQY